MQAIEPAITRIYDRESAEQRNQTPGDPPRPVTAKGVGFLVGERVVMTAAHVVVAALGLPREAMADAPTGSVTLDFPYLQPGRPIQARVLLWRPDDYDVCVLQLQAPPPEDAARAWLLVPENYENIRFTTFGYPRGYLAGTLTSGITLGNLTNGSVQVEAERHTGFRLQEGFSGGPVYSMIDERDGVIGMVVRADRDEETRAGEMLPSRVLKPIIERVVEPAERDDLPPVAPRPDAGWFSVAEAPAFPERPMYALDPVRARDIPADPGMVWGLGRGSTVGLLCTHTPGASLASVIRTEQALHDLAQRGDQQAAKLARRWWLRVQWTRYPHGPNDPDEVWQIAGPAPQRDYLQEHGLPEGDALGLVLTVDVASEAQAGNPVVYRLWQWIRAIYTHVFPGREIVFLIEFVHTSLHEARQMAAMLADQPAAYASGGEAAVTVPPIEQFFNLPVIVNQTDAAPANPRSRLARLRGTQIRGESYCRFFEHLVVEHIDDVTLRIDANLQALYDARKHIMLDKDAEPPHEYAGLRDFIDLVQDMDGLVPQLGTAAANIDVDLRLLQMTRRFKPMLLYHLVKAYAFSTRPGARQSALIFACDPALDRQGERSGAYAADRDDEQDLPPGTHMLVDAWLEGADTNGVLHTPVDLRLVERRPAMAVVLLLGLLRYGRRQGRLPEMLKVFQQMLAAEHTSDDDTYDEDGDLLAPYQDVLPVALQDVIRLVHDPDTAGRFWQRARHDEARILYLARTGLPVAVPGDLATIARHDFPEFWWWIQSLHPTPDLMTALLRLTTSQRAVLGLLNTGEWAELGHDPTLSGRLKRSRRRPLFFRAADGDTGDR